MITLPIPMFGAIVLGFLLLKLWLTDRRFGPLAWLLAVCAVQSCIIALAQHYQIAGFRLLQPIMATTIPAIAWLAFIFTARRGHVWHDGLHGLVPVLAALILITRPYLLDAFIPSTFIAYGAAIMWNCRGGADSLPRVRLETGILPVRIWFVIGLVLVLSAFGDVIVVGLAITGHTWLQPLLVSIYSAANLLLIGILSLADVLKTHPIDDTPVSTSPTPTPLDAEAFATLESTMTAKRPYLDPDLSLIKLARMTGIPAKKLSTAINRATGDNVSRYINHARIKAAQDMLKSGQSVTTTMYDAGFNTKSNFNREFLRVTGVSPSTWLEGQKKG